MQTFHFKPAWIIFWVHGSINYKPGSRLAIKQSLNDQQTLHLTGERLWAWLSVRKAWLWIVEPGKRDFVQNLGFGPFISLGIKMCSELIHWKLSGLSASTFQHWLLLFHRPAHLVHNLIYHRMLSFSFTVGVLPLATSQISCIQWQHLSFMRTIIFLACCLFVVCVSACVWE